ncbi:CoA transferase [Caballeronia sp. GAWG2-1]|uniref:CaiB/BaiF CoA transferase family protein n=1 Tax=Caballeronia sp. GAWG2-1 TaxID=2921744 RepID=UPI0025410D83|nr:CoA transferase [Caballeronia sp. GAWG2-1]
MSETTVSPSQSLPRVAPGGRLELLKGIRVLDLTTSIAGPYGTMLLGDFGAEIIKVERPKYGDDSRQWSPPSLAGQALWFLSVNRNKKSVTIDFSTAKGLDILHSIVKECDVIVTNQLPSVLTKLKIRYEDIRAVRPDIVYVSLTGFGIGGGRQNDPCYDLIAEGFSGVMDLTGELDSDPQKVGTPAADLLSGTDAAMACLAALMDRTRTGNGHFVEVSLVESMTRFLTPRVVSYLGSGEVPRRSGAKDSVIAIYQVFATADEPITLALPNDAIWLRFCSLIGRGDLAQDQTLATNAGRVLRRRELVEQIQHHLVQHPRSYWLAMCREHKVPAGPINRVDQVVQDEELLARQLFYTMEHQESPIPQVGLGIRFNKKVAGYDRAPPKLGEDTISVLKGIVGASQQEIDAYKNAGVI